MEKKAVFVKVLRNTDPFDRHAWEHLDLLYTYRGHEYIVTKHNNGCMDSLKGQHEFEQARIDRIIENENKPAGTYETSGQAGFDLFWNSMEEDIV